VVGADLSGAVTLLKLDEDGFPISFIVSPAAIRISGSVHPEWQCKRTGWFTPVNTLKEGLRSSWAGQHTVDDRPAWAASIAS
jgi:hypothetical protein